MAITFNTFNLYGLEKAEDINMSKIEEIGRVIDLSTRVENIKDPLYVLVNLEGVSLPTSLSVLTKEKKTAFEIELTPNTMNVAAITTYGCIGEDNMINFEFNSPSDDITPEMNIAICGFSHVPVVSR